MASITARTPKIISLLSNIYLIYYFTIYNLLLISYRLTIHYLNYFE
jgi:hypothetical protein